MLTPPTDDVIVGEPLHASVAVAEPNATVIADAVGLQPNGTFE